VEQPSEKRHFSRIPFQGPVHVTSVNGKWDTDLLDISLNGALIRKPDNWPGKTDEHFMLVLDLTNSDVDIRMEAVIAHEEKDRVGLQCKHIDLDSITHLRRLVELNLGDALMLKRELSALG